MDLMTSEPGFRATSVEEDGDATVDTLSHATGECVLGRVLVARSNKGICAILLGDSQSWLETDLAVRFPRVKLLGNDRALQADLAKVIRFAERPAQGLRLRLDMHGTAFQRRVWEKLRAIRAGRTVTYLELARWIRPLASPRAVAGACAANPIALAVPCHRVVRSNGDLGGYRWGTERKRELLRREAMA